MSNLGLLEGFVCGTEALKNSSNNHAFFSLVLSRHAVDSQGSTSSPQAILTIGISFGRLSNKTPNKHTLDHLNQGSANSFGKEPDCKYFWRCEPVTTQLFATAQKQP